MNFQKMKPIFRWKRTQTKIDSRMSTHSLGVKMVNIYLRFSYLYILEVIIQTLLKLITHVNFALEPLIGTVTEKRTLIGMLVWAIQEKFENNSVRNIKIVIINSQTSSNFFLQIFKVVP